MVSSSPYPSIEIPKVDIWDFLFERDDREWPDDQVIYVSPEQGRQHTYQTIRHAAICFGRNLASRWSWQNGDVLSLFLHNSIDVPVLIWGCHWAGGVVQPSDPSNTARKYAFQLADSKAKAIVTEKALLEVVIDAAQKAGIARTKIIVLGGRDQTMAGFACVDDFSRCSVSPLRRKYKVDPGEDVAFLCYTTGTTGTPKGVMLTHRNIIANILQNRTCDAQYLSWKGGKAGGGSDIIMGFLPFCHIYGLTSVLHLSMYAGLCVIVMRRFELQKFCSYVQKYRVTFANIVPPVVLLLAKHPIVEKYDLSSLKMLMCGSAPLTKEFAETAHKRIKVPIKQGYGLTETSPTTHLQPWDRWSLWGSVGLLLPNQVTMCVDTEGQEVLKGQSGELWIKGPNIFMGYFGNPMATRRAFSADGFFKTGDMGFEDHNGNFYITGRIEDQIDVGDAQIAPAELEGLLLSHPKVNDVAVLGIRDVDRLSQKPRAYILPMQGVSCTKTTGEEICSWLSERLPPHKRLTGGIRWVNSIPKSNSGKILRRVLTEQIERYEKKVKA